VKSGMDEDLYRLYKRLLNGDLKLHRSYWSNEDDGLVIEFSSETLQGYRGVSGIQALVLIPVNEYDKDHYKLYTPDYDNYEF